MPGVLEGVEARSSAAAAQDLGVKLLSSNQTITFTKYVKLVLPLDGFLFWVRADLLGPSAEPNASAANTFTFNQAPRVSDAAETFDAPGSLHYMTEQYQTEEENFALNRVIFTSQTEVNGFETMTQDELYIGSFDGLRFAFSSQASFYRQMQEWHYRGDAIYPSMESQIIDSLAGFDTRDVVVSNSLPVWLTLNRFMPMYPSFLARDNLRPPYAVVHIPPEATRALQPVPLLGPRGTHTQLVSDQVKVTMYGLRNFNALDFQDYVLDYMLNEDVIGLMNMPIIRDEKRTQNELNTLAMKKSITFEVSYFQVRVRDVARQLILSCIPTINVRDQP